MGESLTPLAPVWLVQQAAGGRCHPNQVGVALEWRPLLLLSPPFCPPRTRQGCSFFLPYILVRYQQWPNLAKCSWFEGILCVSILTTIGSAKRVAPFIKIPKRLHYTTLPKPSVCSCFLVPCGRATRGICPLTDYAFLAQVKNADGCRKEGEDNFFYVSCHLSPTLFVELWVLTMVDWCRFCLIGCCLERVQVWKGCNRKKNAPNNWMSTFTQRNERSITCQPKGMNFPNLMQKFVLAMLNQCNFVWIAWREGIKRNLLLPVNAKMTTSF